MSVLLTPMRALVGGLSLCFLVAVGKCSHEKMQNNENVGDVTISETGSVIINTFDKFGKGLGWLYGKGEDAFQVIMPEDSGDEPGGQGTQNDQKRDNGNTDPYECVADITKC